MQHAATVAAVKSARVNRQTIMHHQPYEEHKKDKKCPITDAVVHLLRAGPVRPQSAVARGPVLRLARKNERKRDRERAKRVRKREQKRERARRTPSSLRQFALQGKGRRTLNRRRGTASSLDARA
eukprot:3592923-Rhodomonas_salina.3